MSSKNISSSKVFRDQTHGNIAINSLEKAIIDHPLFQRLRFISHLGLANYVYPGATHSRFSHSIGAMHVAELVTNSLELKFNEKQLIKIAALLHDIGHLPLSHALERIFSNEKTGKPFSHEELGSRIITETSLANLLQNEKLLGKYGIKQETLKPQLIAYLSNGKHSKSFMNQILSSTLDVDRLDFLLRDCSNTGVDYGRIDLNRIIQFLILKEEFNTEKNMKEEFIVAEKKAQVAIENFLMAHYFMYKTVYKHRVINGFEHMAREFIRECQKKGDIPYTLNEAIQKYGKRRNGDEQASFEVFILRLNDTWFFSKLQEKATSLRDLNDKAGHLACRIIKRKPLKLIRQINAPSWDEEAIKFIEFQQIIENSNEEFAKWCFCVDGGKGLTISDFRKSDDPNKKYEMVRILDKDGEVKPLCKMRESFLSYLRDFDEIIHRIYTIEEYEEKIKREVDEFFGPPSQVCFFCRGTKKCPICSETS